MLRSNCAWGLLSFALLTGCSSTHDTELASDDGEGNADAASDTGGARATGGRQNEDGGTSFRDVAPKGGGGGSAGRAGAGGTTGTGGRAGTGGSAGSGGSNATGGSVGTGGAPPTQVLACDSLAPVGQWEKVTPPGVTFTQDFGLDPTHPGTVYLGAGAGFDGRQGGIYKTTDCGASWTHVSTGALGADMDASPGHWTLAVDPVDPEIVYTANGYGTSGVFKSINGGVDWTQILPPDIAKAFTNGGFVERIAMDPTNRLHLTVTPHFVCEAPHTTNCMLETNDGGSTWRVIENTPPGGEDTGQMMIDGKHWLYAAGDWNLYATLDGGASWKAVFKGWTTDQDPYRASDGAYYLASESSGVLRSADGLTWAAIPNSPTSIRAVIGDGTTLFASNRRDCSPNCQPYSSAPESTFGPWKTYASPALPRGGWRLHYDTSHHLLYSSTETNGLWRVVTK